MSLITFRALTFLTIAFAVDYVELWSIEQLDDMILSDAYKYSVPARTPALLLLYESHCTSQIDPLLSQLSAFPNSMYFLVAGFDRKYVKEHITYNWNSTAMDVFARYKIDTSSSNWCPTVLFQPSNWSDPVSQWDPSTNPNLGEWTWSKLDREVTFTNTLSDPVQLLLKQPSSLVGQQEIELDVIADTIPPGETKKVHFYVSSIVTVVHQTTRAILDKFGIFGETSMIKIENKSELGTVKTTNGLANEMDSAYNLRLQRDWSTRRRYLNNIRAPPLMPSFTKLGFKKLDMPDDICSYLKNFFLTLGSKGQVENFPTDATQINTREVDTLMKFIPYEKQIWIAERLQAMLEEWSQQKLQFVVIYGLREYQKGAVLKTHVDRMETHIVSAILHVLHKPETEYWPLELTSFDGKRYYVVDSECQMVFYESSKLIHGRPSTYNGTSWVNAFLHYRPVDWKGYEFTSDNVVVTPSKSVHLVDGVYG